MIRFLVVNEMHLRGEHFSRGKLLNLFEFVASKDEKLAGIVETVPANAKYSSPDIQNEIISITSEIVRSKVMHEVRSSDGECYIINCDGTCDKNTMTCDGTRDKNNVEELSIIVRFVKDGESMERLLQMTPLGELDAQSMATKILSVFETSGFHVNRIISQCYDGASIVSGVCGGVQELIQHRLKKVIPCIHCLDHQLHLVVVHALEVVVRALEVVVRALEVVVRALEVVVRALEVVVRALEVVVRALEVVVRALEVVVRALEVVVRALEVVVRALEVVVRALEVVVRALEVVVRALEVVVRALEVVVRALEVVVRALEVVVRALEVVVRALEVVVRALEVVVRALEVVVRALEVVVRALEVVVRALEVVVRALEVVVHALEVVVRALEVVVRALEVVVRALEHERAVRQFTELAAALYNFTRKPVISNIYEGDKLKRLPDQRWTGPYETVKVMIGSHAALVDVLDEATRSATLPGDVNALAAGLATKILEPKFLFIAHLLHAALGLLQPPNQLLQADITDLALDVEPVESTILA